MRLFFKNLALFLFFCFLPFWSQAEDANSIVVEADRIRVPAGSYEEEVTIVSFEGDKKVSENGYKIYVKDLDHTLVEFLSPATEKGKSLLMLGDDLWIYLPNVKKPVRIPMNQRLVGDVSNGDMARVNFAHDYDATLTGSETVDGKDCYVLDLKAKSASKTYSRVKYWVSKSDNRPVQAEYFTASGQSLKTCKFEDFQMQAGTMRPMRYVFWDSVRKNNKSILTFSNMITKKMNDSMFTKEYMQTLE